MTILGQGGRAVAPPAIRNDGTPAPRRVTVVAPNARADVSLPAQASLAEAVHQLVTLLELGAGEGGAADGWHLSRLGAAPFAVEQSVGASGIRDGDVLYLSSHRSRLPPVVFDDLVDAVASAAAGRSSRWTPDTTRRAGLFGALGIGVATAGLLLVSGPTWAAPALVAAGLAAVLLLCGGLLSRHAGRSALGAAVAGTGVGFATMAATVGAAAARPLADLGAAHLLLGCTCLLSVAAVAHVVVNSQAPSFLAAALFGALGAATLAGAMVAGVTPGTAVAIGLPTLLVASTAAPGLAMRLAQLPFPHVPADPAEFRLGDTATFDSDVIERSRSADRFLTGILVATGAMIVVTAVVLAGSPSPWEVALGATAGALWTLRSRHLRHGRQRVVMMATGLAALTVTVGPFAASLPDLTKLGIAAGLVGLGAPLLTVAVNRPVRSFSPYWGRAMDVAELLAAVAVVPLVVGTLDLYRRVLGLGG